MQIIHTPLRVITLAAVWLCASASVSAASADVYAGGEALAPEVEAQLLAQTTGQASRSDVQQALADAQAAGTLAASGELSDTPQVLQARLAFNHQQEQTILARYAAEQQQRLAAQPPAQPLALAQTADATAQPLQPAAGANPPGEALTAAAVQPTAEVLIDEATAPETPAPLDAPADNALSTATPPMARPDELPLDGPVDTQMLNLAIDTE